MHATFERLKTAAKQLKGKEGPAEIGRLIGESEQTMSNWKSRGVPRAKHVDISDTLGCRPEWLAYGHGTMVPGTGETDPSLRHISERQVQQYAHKDKTIAQIVAILEATDDVGRGAALLAVIEALNKVRPAKEIAA